MKSDRTHPSTRIPSLLLLALMAAFLFGFKACSYDVHTSAAPAEGGSVRGSGTYRTGKTATVSAVPRYGYRFVDWTEGGSSVSDQAEYSFTVEDTHSLVANFALDDSIASTICEYSEGDSQQVDPSLANVPGGETLRPESHLQGSQIYHRLGAVRLAADGSAVSIDYMVHQPMGSPRGIVVLIPDGGMNARLAGRDGQPATRSGGDFLIRSAHRFADQGYLAISLDRPSDYPDFGNIDLFGSRYDAYRNSMLHAVDLAEVIGRENADNLPVFLVGTGRGAISAYANNSLATGIALSASPASPETVGQPIGSDALPLDRNQRPTHILIQNEDACGSTSPVYSEDLFFALMANGVPVRADAVSGGFRDSRRDQACGAYDYHGFTGIETCAVGLSSGALDAILDDFASFYRGNHPPVGTEVSDIAVNIEGMDLNNFASDADGDALRFSLPYGHSTLGGMVSVSEEGIVSYQAPGLGGTTDKFVYVVSDGRGGVGRGVVSVQL